MFLGWSGRGLGPKPDWSLLQRAWIHLTMGPTVRVSRIYLPHGMVFMRMVIE